MPSHVSLCLDVVITGYIGVVVPKVCPAPPNEQLPSIPVKLGVVLLLTLGLAQGRRDQRHDCD